MKILVTGGAGFLGTSLVKRGLENNDELYVFDNLSKKGGEENLSWLKSLGLEKIHLGDIRDKETVEQVVKNFQPDVIFHTAAQVAMTTSLENPMNDFQTNTVGTLNLLEAVRLYSPETRFVYTSSNKVYGSLEQIRYEERPTRYVALDYSQGYDEQLPLQFTTPYGCSKGSADQYVLDYSRCFGLKTAVFRFSSLYGDRQFATEYQGWIGWFVQKALAQLKQTEKNFVIHGDGKQVRDILYIDDAVNAFYQWTQSCTQFGEAYNLGGGQDNSLSLLELFHYLENKLRINMSYEKKKMRQSDQKVFVAKTQKAQEHFNWRPKTPYTQGLSKTIDWEMRE